MTIQECYKKMGADYQEVLGRLYNEAMICKFVRMFLQDDSFQILEEALRRGDVKEAFCLLCDLIARSLFAPMELSISAVTAVFGAPVVIGLLLRRNREDMR